MVAAAAIVWTRQFCILFLRNWVFLKKKKKKIKLGGSSGTSGGIHGSPACAAIESTWFSHAWLYFCSLLLPEQFWLPVIILPLKKFEDGYPSTLLLRCPWQDISVKASGSCGLEITSVK